MEWPKDYVGEVTRRMELEHGIAQDPELIEGARKFYASSFPDFVADCVWVAEPRNAGKGEPVFVPVVPFPRQIDFMNWLVERYQTKTSGPVEKSRDSGATWIASAFSVWLWDFHDGAVTGFGSRKEDLVDQAGVMDSIFEKIRSIIRRLPFYLKPPGLSEKKHFNHMRIQHPDPLNGAAIIGEAGDNIGRGGRTSVYIIDESAFLERPQKVESSLTATTDCRIDISTPLVGSVFNAWTDSTAPPLKFIFDINDAPWHTAEWKATKESDLKSKGLGHIFRQEYLRDATAGIVGQLIAGEWIEACVGAADKLGIGRSGAKRAGMDVADGGQDLNALALQHGIEIVDVTGKPELHADQAALWAYADASLFGAEYIKYDNIGVGAGAASIFRQKPDLKSEGWSASAAVWEPKMKYPDPKAKKTMEEMFSNAKAQGWWLLRDRIFYTYRCIKGDLLAAFDPDMIISFSPQITELRQLKSELAQIVTKPNNAGKQVIDKTPDGKRSPNFADAVMICNAPSQKKVVLHHGLV